MEQKQHLQHLLNEEQEPFILNNFINERRNLRKKTHVGKVHDSRSVFTTLKRSKSGGNSCFSDRFCFNLRSACLTTSSSIESPSSPFLLLDTEHRRHLSVSSSTIRNFLEVELVNNGLRKKQSSYSPASTPTESWIHSFRRSLSIKKHSSSALNLKKSCRYNLFRSIIKRLIPAKSQSFIKIRSLSKQNRKVEMRKESCTIFEGKKGIQENKGSSGLGFSCSSNNSSAWSESDESETKSVDLDSNSSRSEDYGEFERVEECRMKLYTNDDEAYTSTSSSANLATEICCSGDSLRTCCSQPEYQSPTASPSRRKTKVEGPCPSSGGSSTGVVREEYENKEQFSPVSVLELPFEEGDGFEHSFAPVQRAKQQLLNKLCRFERLGGLDPLELVRRIAEEEIAESLETEILNGSSLVGEILNGSSCHCPSMNSLVRDLIEEESGDGDLNLDDLVRKISQRIGDWKSVESHTIDMIVEMDFRRDADKWRIHGDQVKETAVEIEIAIFGFLLEELSFDLSRSMLDKGQLLFLI